MSEETTVYEMDVVNSPCLGWVLRNAELGIINNRLREGVGTALQVIPERFEDLSPVQKSRIIRKVQAVLIALQEADDAPRGEG